MYNVVKGLGAEMNPYSLREPTMDPNIADLVQLIWMMQDANVEMMICYWLKKRAPDRKEWLESKVI